MRASRRQRPILFGDDPGSIRGTAGANLQSVIVSLPPGAEVAPVEPISRRTAVCLGAGSLAALAWTLTGPRLATPPVAAQDDTPAATPGLGEIVAIATGGGHFLALRADGIVWSWGTNSDWELGVTTPDLTMDLPVRIAGLANVCSLATGLDHGLALTEEGAVWAWGKNTHGQVGSATAICPVHNRPCAQAPVPVPGLPPIAALAAAEDSSFALAVDGSVWAWGDNRTGQLGLGTTADPPGPSRVAGLPEIVALSAGEDRVAALAADRTVWAWDAETSSHAPAMVSGLTDVIAVAADRTRFLALRRDDIVWTWGERGAESLEAVDGFGAVRQLAGGGMWSAVLDRDGLVWLWINRDTPPTRVTGLSDVTAIAMGSDANLALTTNGMVWTWSAFVDPAPVSMPQQVGTPGP